MAALFHRMREGLAAVLGFETAIGVAERAVYLSSVRVGPRQHALLLIDERGTEIGRMPLAGRGHDIAVDKAGGRVAVFARRPGYFAVIVDGRSLSPLATIRPPEGHHFFGHGAFSADGHILYATENVFTTEQPRGVVGVYDVSGDFRRIGEFETHGMDSHEILMAPDGQTLVVANGGIETHPEFGRQKLNVADMRPSIVRIDSATGDLIGETQLDAGLNQLSTRHMAFDGSGALWFGCQWEGEKGRRPPLVGRIDGEGEAMLLPFPDAVAPLARNYIGSVVASRDGTAIAASSPIGGTIFVFDAERKALHAAHRLRDGCGLAGASGEGFLASAGDGRLMHVAGEIIEPITRVGAVEFDNHMRRIDLG
ncbi:hypothetical protein SAMN02745157_1698 [Kaistia soli DSM 19436]|uniref:DUF1513 domain-containing protein n=1 Tax=Kaistia soli DSM 19436 TaxID=1122133 RepID=A0A1M4Z434_9HYPH|nr:DUF1513 domain-containing protein [Kaistia soli]SHF12356.1 hypothetical protein SAMN02745157_1698 [Kaistia soli DSM 19436]